MNSESCKICSELNNLHNSWDNESSFINSSGNRINTIYPAKYVDAKLSAASGFVQSVGRKGCYSILIHSLYQTSLKSFFNIWN